MKRLRRKNKNISRPPSNYYMSILESFPVERLVERSSFNKMTSFPDVSGYSSGRSSGRSSSRSSYRSSCRSRNLSNDPSATRRAASSRPPLSLLEARAVTAQKAGIPPTPQTLLQEIVIPPLPTPVAWSTNFPHPHNPPPIPARPALALPSPHAPPRPSLSGRNSLKHGTCLLAATRG
jgi:hypothetical protein